MQSNTPATCLDADSCLRQNTSVVLVVLWAVVGTLEPQEDETIADSRNVGGDRHPFSRFGHGG